MKKIIIYVLTIFMLLALIYKVLHPNNSFDNQGFLEYMAECPQITIKNVASTIQSDWGDLNFIRTFLNSAITVFNFLIKFILNITQAMITIFYAITYFFTIEDVTDNQNTSTGGGSGGGWLGGR